MQVNITFCSSLDLTIWNNKSYRITAVYQKLNLTQSSKFDLNLNWILSFLNQIAFNNILKRRVYFSWNWCYNIFLNIYEKWCYNAAENVIRWRTRSLRSEQNDRQKGSISKKVKMQNEISALLLLSYPILNLRLSF